MKLSITLIAVCEHYLTEVAVAVSGSDGHVPGAAVPYAGHGPLCAGGARPETM